MIPIFDLPHPMSWAERRRAIRAALAGVPVTTPIELIAMTGLDIDEARFIDRQIAAMDLKEHGYKLERVVLGVYGRPVKRYVRREHWPEDDQWDKRC